MRTAVHEIAQIRQVEDLAVLADDLPLLLRVAVREEDVDLRERVERDRVWVDGGHRRLARDVGADLALELGERVRAGARDGLVGVDDDPFEPDRVAQRHQDRCELHRRAVRVGDDPGMALEIVRVDLRDDERDGRVHPPGGRVVDDRRAMGDRSRREVPRDVGPRGEQRDVDAVECVRDGLTDVERATLDRDGPPADRPEASRRSSPTGNSRSLRIWIIVRPTTPVAPTTATVRGSTVHEGHGSARSVARTGTARVYQRAPPDRRPEHLGTPERDEPPVARRLVPVTG